MPYITIQDFSQAILLEIRHALSRYSDEIVIQAALRAEREMESRLSARYKIADELAKTGAARNAMLVGVCVDIAIYYLYGTQESIPNIRVKKYDDAVAILRDIAKGLSNLTGLPLAPAEGTGSIAGNIAHGSQTKRDNAL